MTDKEYYQRELEKINPHGEHAPILKITDQNKGECEPQMRHISINSESATALVEWLTANFLEA